MRRVALVCLLATVGLVAWAGDIAAFQNLGFSADSRYFMFGQYGVSDRGGTPYADVYIVDVPRNDFVSGAVKSIRPATVADPASSGIEALFALYRDAVAMVQKYSVEPTRTGRPVYILVDGETPKETIEFRDFPSGSRYKVSLYQQAAGSGDAISASFHIALSRTKGDDTSTYTIGLPHYSRKGVRQYAIKQIIVAPDETSLVVVVEKRESNGTPGGYSARYMVETLRLQTQTAAR